MDAPRLWIAWPMAVVVACGVDVAALPDASDTRS